MPVPTRSRKPLKFPNGPIRTCIGCGSKRPQSRLVRFVRPCGMDRIIGRLLPGRGYYVCSDRSCVKRLDQRLKRWFDFEELKRAGNALEAVLEEDRSATRRL